jgi:hypothetical protein
MLQLQGDSRWLAVALLLDSRSRLQALVGMGEGGRRWLEEAGSTGKGEKDSPVEERWVHAEGGGSRSVRRVEAGGACEWLWEQQAEAGEGNEHAVIKALAAARPPSFLQHIWYMYQNLKAS